MAENNELGRNYFLLRVRMAMMMLPTVVMMAARTESDMRVADNLSASNFGPPNTFIDPRRAMVGVRMNLGR